MKKLEKGITKMKPSELAKSNSIVIYGGIYSPDYEITFKWPKSMKKKQLDEFIDALTDLVDEHFNGFMIED